MLIIVDGMWPVNDTNGLESGRDFGLTRKRLTRYVDIMKELDIYGNSERSAVKMFVVIIQYSATSFVRVRTDTLHVFSLFCRGCVKNNHLRGRCREMAQRCKN